MKKILRIEGLDCANCAGEIERAVSKISGVESASVSFMTQRLSLELIGENCDAILDQVIKVCKKVEPDCKIKL